MPPARALAVAFLLAAALSGTHAAERIYYIAADTVVWDYAPSYPLNPITGQPFNRV
jgi:hypothetical protein